MTIPKSISENKTLLSTADVAKQLKVHRSTVNHWIKEGMLPSERHGSFHAVKPKDLKRFLSIYDVQPKKTRKRKAAKRAKKSAKKRGKK